MMDELLEKFNFLKSRNYKKSNHPGVEVFYDKQTFLKINKKTKITITPGSILFIIKKAFGLKEGSLQVLKEMVQNFYHLPSQENSLYYFENLHIPYLVLKMELHGICYYHYPLLK